MNSSKQEKLQILTLLPSNWTVQDIQEYFQVSKYMITLAKKLQNEKGSMSALCVRKDITHS